MEFVRICVLNSLDEPVCFMDNSRPGSLHYWDDLLHIYLKGSASTFSFSCDVTHPDSEKLVVGARISFVKDNVPYYFTITNTEQTETTLTVTCYATALGLINTYVGELMSPGLHTIEWYIDTFDEFNFIKVGSNEIASKQLEIEYTNDETLLSRLFNLAEEFDVEIAFEPTLNNDYSLKNILVNIYRSHDDETGAQGIGTRRTDKVIRYGLDINGVHKTADISELYTAICPIGKDDTINLYSKSETVVYDSEGNIEFRKPAQSKYIYAVQAKDRFPSSILAQGTERYIAQRWNYTTGSQTTLYQKALAELKKKCVPKLTYEIEGYLDCNIGDTFTIQDEEFYPKLYLEARVTEIERSFTNPANGAIIIDNFKEFSSQINAGILSKIQELSESVREDLVIVEAKADQAQEDANSSFSKAESAESEAEKAKNQAILAETLATTAQNTANDAKDKTKYIRFYTNYGLAISKNDLSNIDNPTRVPSTIIDEKEFRIYGVDESRSTNPIAKLAEFGADKAIIGPSEPYSYLKFPTPITGVRYDPVTGEQIIEHGWADDGFVEYGIPYHAILDSKRGFIIRSGPQYHFSYDPDGPEPSAAIPTDDDIIDLFKMGMIDGTIEDPRYGIQAAYDMWLRANQVLWLNSENSDVKITAPNGEVQFDEAKDITILNKNWRENIRYGRSRIALDDYIRSSISRTPIFLDVRYPFSTAKKTASEDSTIATAVRNVAKTYYDNRGTSSNPSFIYRQTATPLDPDFVPGTRYLDCSSFVQLVLAGIPFSDYPMTNDKVKPLTDWGFLPSQSGVRSAADMAFCFARSGCVVDGVVYGDNYDFSNVQRGDLVFFAKGSQPNRYLGISHVAIISSVTSDGTHTIYDCSDYAPYITNRTLETTYYKTGSDVEIRQCPEQVVLVVRPNYKTVNGPANVIERVAESSSKDWTLIKSSTTQATISNLSSYKEFMLQCVLNQNNGYRVLASTILTADELLSYTTDHADGAHQARYSSSTSYSAGVSYLGNNSVKLYHTGTNAYARLYAR